VSALSIVATSPRGTLGSAIGGPAAPRRGNSVGPSPAAPGGPLGGPLGGPFGGLLGAALGAA